MVESITTAAWIFGAYFVGSIPFGVLVGRLRGVDVRGQGSGNIGATNVARAAGRKLGLVVLVLDAAKGYVPLALLMSSAELPQPAEGTLFVIAIAPVLGHCFSPWLRFRGGKGVATTLGLLLASDPVLAAIACAVFGAVYLVTRVVSIASLTCAALLPVGFWLRSDSGEYLLMSAFVAAIIVIQHRSNIRRILNRAELRL